MNDLIEKSSNAKNLFVIKSPLQMINAFEAIDYFKLTNNILIVVENATSKNVLQIHNLIQQHNWIEVIIIQHGKSKFFQYLKLIHYLKKIQFNFMIIGDLGNVTKAILANVNKKIIYYIDDGAATLKDYNNYIKVGKINKNNFKEFRYILFGLKIFVKDTINMFTFLDLEPSEIKVIKHNFNYFKNKLIKDFTHSENIYFLGQPLEGYIKEETYINYLTSLIRKFPNKKIIYMSHRSENTSQKHQVKALENDLFKFVENEMP
ncbi:MAG: hypothetical protein U9N59_06975, partial [Campylobacterota bacterium]|nr:hypothetical protein [Campylobacterota bacterium]